MPETLRVYNEDDLLEAKRGGILIGTGIAIIIGAVITYCMEILNRDNAYFANIGKEHVNAVTEIAIKFTNTESLTLEYDPKKDPSYLQYTDKNGLVIRSIRLVCVDQNKQMIIVFQDNDGDTLIDQDGKSDEECFPTPENAMLHIESLAK